MFPQILTLSGWCYDLFHHFSCHPCLLIVVVVKTDGTNDATKSRREMIKDGWLKSLKYSYLNWMFQGMLITKKRVSSNL